VERKAFLIALMTGAPLAACKQTPIKQESEDAKDERESNQTILFTTADLNNMMDVFAGAWFREDQPIKILRTRDRLWRKLLTFTDEENQKLFKEAFLDDFLENMPLIAYKYFIKDSDLDPEDIPKLKEKVKASIR
jgi:hypothetical protein